MNPRNKKKKPVYPITVACELGTIASIQARKSRKKTANQIHPPMAILLVMREGPV
jgi:hypothetical protein